MADTINCGRKCIKKQSEENLSAHLIFSISFFHVYVCVVCVHVYEHICTETWS